MIGFLPTGSTPLSLSSTPDWTVLGFTAMVSMLAGIVFGLVPALQSTRPQLANTLKDQAGAVLHGGSGEATQGPGGGPGGAVAAAADRRGTVPAEPAQPEIREPGFRRARPAVLRGRTHVEPLRHGLDTRLLPPSDGPPENRAGDQVETLAVVPVLQDNEWDNWVTIEGYTPKQGEMPDPHMQYCSPDYFATLKVPHPAGPRFHDQRCRGRAARWALSTRNSRNAISRERTRWAGMSGMGIDPGTKMDIEIVGVVGRHQVREHERGNALRVVHPLRASGFRQRHDGVPARARRSGGHLQHDAAGGTRGGSRRCRCTTCGRWTTRSRSRC